MKTTLKISIATIAIILCNTIVNAQIKIGNNPTTINANSLLELETTNKGLLMPRIALTSTAAFSPLAAHIAGMTVYNTATSVDVTPGYYYNDGTKWVRIADAKNFWALLGNSGTNDINNFVGTTDAQALHFRVNGTPAGLLDYANAAQGANPGANVIFGYNAAPGITSALNNASNTNNVIIGYEAGKAQTASYRNTYIGARAGLSTTTAHENVAIGWEAGKALTTGFWNTSLGVYAGQGTTTGTENVSVGFTAGSSITTGMQNVGIGDYAGNGNSTGSNNTFLGYQADATVDGLTNATAIGNKAKVSISNAIVLGGTGTNGVKVGIGTTAPTETLDVTGNVKFSGALMPNNLPGTNGQVLTSAGAGAAPTWRNGPWTGVWMGFSTTSSAPGTIIGGSYAVYGTGGAASASSITVPTTGVYKISLSLYDFYLTAAGTSNYNYLVNGTIVNLLADNDISFADQGFRISNFVYKNLNAGDVITISKSTPVNSSYLIEGYLEVTRMQ